MGLVAFRLFGLTDWASPGSFRSKVDRFAPSTWDVNLRTQGYLAHKKQPPLGPNSRTKPRALW